jgi:hypothetical protein
MKRVFSLFSGSKQTKQPRKTDRGSFRPMFESLESRRNCAVVVGMDQGALVIVGDSADDIVRVREQGDQIQVGVAVPGQPVSFHNAADYSQVRAIIFKGGSGDDHFINRTNLPLRAEGGLGDDTIYGGIDGFAEIYGGGDNDTLIGTKAGNRIEGGEGDDDLFGLEGRDVLFGGPGQDDLHGYEGADLLFGGPGSDNLMGGPDPDFLEGGRDLTPDFLYGEWRDGMADLALDMYVEQINESQMLQESDNGVLYATQDYEDVYRSNPDAVWQILLGTSSSGLSLDDGLSFEFEIEDHDISVVEPDWQNEIAPVDDYFAEMNEALVESAEDETSWAEETELAAAEEVDQDAINDAALLALLAEESLSLEESDPAADESELLESDEAFEIDPTLTEEPELTDNEILEPEVSLVEVESPAEEPAAETTAELVAVETYTPSWSSQYRPSSWAKFRW